MKLIRFIIYILVFAIPIAIWNGNITAIEIKDFIATLGIWAIGLAAAFELFVRKNISLRRDRLLAAVSIYALIMIASYFRTTRASMHDKALLPQVLGIAIFFAAIYAIRQDILKRLFAIWTAAGAITSIYALIQYAGYDFIDWQHEISRNEISSFFGNKNYLGLYLVLSIPLAVSQALCRKKIFAKILYAIAVLIMLCALVISGSRGGLLGFALSSIVFGLLFAGKAHAKPLNAAMRMLTVLLPIALLILVAAFIPMSIKADLAHYLKQKQYSERISYQVSALRIIRTHAVFGVGPGNFASFYPEAGSDRFNNGRPDRMLVHVHNDILETWLEHGFVGLSAYCAVVVLLVWQLFRAWPQSSRNGMQTVLAGAVSALGGYFTYSFFTVATRMVSSTLFFWLLMAIVYIITSSAREDAKIIEINNRRLIQFGPISVLAAAIALAFFVQAAIVSVNYYRSDILLKQAHDAAGSGNLFHAQRALNRAITLRPRSVEAYYQRGYIHYMNKKFDKALADYKRVESLMPNFANSAFNKASCYYAKRDWENAIRLAKQSYALYPRYIDATRMLAFCYYNTGQFKKSLDFCRTALSIRHWDPKCRELKKALEAGQKGRSASELMHKSK